MLFKTHDIFVNGKEIETPEQLIGVQVLNKRNNYFTIQEVISVDVDRMKVRVKESDKDVILMEKYFTNLLFKENIQKRFQDFLITHDILYVLHFTDIMNLESILNQGLLTRDQLDSDINSFNDMQRFDRTDAICASVSFPNYKMFYKCRDENHDKEWCIISLKPHVLYKYDCGFFYTNAASKVFVDRFSEKYKGIEAFKKLFRDSMKHSTKGIINRIDLKIPTYYTTDPQAEVLFFESIPVDDIEHVFLSTDEALEYFSHKYPEIRFIKDIYYFKPRVDHESW